MAYGLGIYNASGVLIYDLEYIPFNFIDRIIVSSSGNNVYTVPPGRILVATIVAGDMSSMPPHSVSVSGGTVTWTVATGPPYAVYVWSEES